MRLNPIIYIASLSIFLLTNVLGPLPMVLAQEIALPQPGTRVSLSPEFNPPVLKGVTIDPQNPFHFDFILDKGDSYNSPPLVGGARGGGNQELKEESAKLIKYFLSAITTPEKDLWVNLSPYEKQRIIPESFGQTDMGRDLLAQDYLLKQITASLIYPEDEFGKKFWKRVYEEAAKKYGNTNVPVNTFNKVWIVPEKAKVYEHGNTAFIVNAKLKVMMEEDYVALNKNDKSAESRGLAENFNGRRISLAEANKTQTARDVFKSAIGTQIIREIVIPALETEVNEGQNFAPLRQVYNSLILAVWFKKRMKDSILGRKYMDQNKVEGIHYESLASLRGIPTSRDDAAISNRTTNDTEAIYQRYLQAFKKGVFNYIKEEDISPPPVGGARGGGTIPRKYFSGGAEMSYAMTTTYFVEDISSNEAQLNDAVRVSVNFGIKNSAMTTSSVDSLAVKFLIKWHEQLNRLVAGRIKWDNVGRKEKIENLARMTDDHMKKALSRLRMVSPRIQFPYLNDYNPQQTQSLGFDLNELETVINNGDAKEVDYGNALKKVVQYTMVRVKQLSSNFDNEYWDTVPEVVSNVIAASSESRLHIGEGDVFRKIMSDGVIQISKELFGNATRMPYRDVLHRMVQARREVAVQLEQTGIIEAFDTHSPERRKGAVGLIPVTIVVSNGVDKSLYDKINIFFARHKNDRAVFIQGKDKKQQECEMIAIPIGVDSDYYVTLPEKLRNYHQRIVFYPKLNSYDIIHGESEFVPDVEQHLEMLWNKIIEKFTPIDERYKALAEFEWYSFHFIPMVRSGAALGDAMSLIAQIITHMPLRNEFRSMDFEALSRTPGEYIRFRYNDLINNENHQRKINASPAMISANPAMNVKKKVGGIDSTVDLMKLDVDSDKAAINQAMDLKALEGIEINGLYIKDIEIKALHNLPEILGVK